MEYFTRAIIDAIALIISFDPEVYMIVWTSLKISLIAIVLGAVSCIPIGFLIAFNKFHGKTFVLQGLNTLMALPTVLIGLLLYGLFTRHGPLGSFDILFTQTGMVIGQCLLIAPIIINLTITTVSSADPRLEQTCKALGANTIQQSVIYINELRFGLMATIVLAFGRAIGEIGIAMMLGGNIEGATRTMTTAIALETSKGDFEFAMALGLVLLSVAFFINVLLYRLQAIGRRA